MREFDFLRLPVATQEIFLMPGKPVNLSLHNEVIDASPLFITCRHFARQFRARLLEGTDR